MEIFCAVLVPVSDSPVAKVNRKRHPRLTDSSKTSSLEDLHVWRDLRAFFSRTTKTSNLKLTIFTF